MCKHLLVGVFWALVGMSLLAGCVTSSPASRYAELFSQDYTAMTDAELIGYEQTLNDELSRSAGLSSSDVSIGFGFGTWSGHSGYGLNTSQRLGGDSGSAIELRSRRDAVRAEMRNRGLLE